MTHSLADAQPIPVDRIFLDLENPRHEPYKNETEVIEYLCREEDVYELAKDIADHGLNPLELFALIPLTKKKGRSPASYMVVEGNRRMCALKLLHDPELAPAKQRKDVAKLAERSPTIAKILAVVFSDKSEVSTIWLPRIHGGVQGGVGRKPWNAEQKTRHIGDKKNVLAQAILDYAEKKHFITAQERKGKLTTAQRYLGNSLLRGAMGIDTSGPDVARTKPKQDFDILLKRFTGDLINGTVHSRSKSKDIVKYSRTLAGIEGLTGKHTEPESLAVDGTSGGRSKKKKATPKRPEKRKKLPYEEEIAEKLKAIPAYKLEQLYWSLCEISLEDHTPLICVGAWCFFECLTALTGRKSGTDFCSYLSKQKLNDLGFQKREDVSSLRQALERISNHGNDTKHHDESAYFNGEQLANDMNVVKKLICKLADDAKTELKKAAA